MSSGSIRDVLADIEEGMTVRADGVSIVGAAWSDSPDLLRDVMREADGWANTHPEHPDAIEHKRRHG